MSDTIRYSIIGATYTGISEHPQKVVESLGMKILKYQAESIADAIFMEVENLPDRLPEYITKSNYEFAI